MLIIRIGNRIKELRISKANLSQEDFALQLGLDRTYLSRIESGKQNLTIEKLNDICNGLHITLNDFFQPFNEFIEEKNEVIVNEKENNKNI